MNERNGFTLIELIISILVMAVGIMGVMQVFPVGMQNTMKAQRYTKCIEYAEQKMEELRTIQFDSLDAYAAGTQIPDNGYLTVWTVSADGNPNPGARRVRIDVYYSNIRDASGMPDTTRAQNHVDIESYISKVYW